ncbi:MAG: DUF4252 domain-containing protein [Bacteroidota bacterium]
MPKGIFLFLISLSFLIPLQVLGQRQLMKDLQSHYPASSIYFLYPSTLRMFNVNKMPEYYQLFNKVNLIVVVNILKQSPTFRKEEIENLKKKLIQEKYQHLFEFGMSENQVAFFKREKNGIPVEMVGFLGMEAQYLAIYVDGFIADKALIGLLKGGFNGTELGTILPLNKEK